MHTERISAFDATVTISGDSVNVKEYISYNFGFQQKHGIFRQFAEGTQPTVTSVGRDGAEEPYTMESADVIKIGDAQKTISGIHDYKIVYEAGPVVQEYEDNLRLFTWTVDGEWNVPIDASTATVQLPEGAQLTQIGCSRSQEELITATAISKGPFCQMAANPDGSVTFVRDEGLLSNQPLVIGVVYVEGGNLLEQHVTSAEHTFTVTGESTLDVKSSSTFRFAKPTPAIYTEYVNGLHPMSGADIVLNDITVTNENGQELETEDISLLNGVHTLRITPPEGQWTGVQTIHGQSRVIGGIVQSDGKIMIQNYLPEKALGSPVDGQADSVSQRFILPDNAIEIEAGCEGTDEALPENTCEIVIDGNEVQLSIEDVPQQTIAVTVTYHEQE